MNVEKMKQVMDEIESGERQTLGMDDTFKFRCKMCGTCCVGQTIVLSVYDVIRLRKALDVKTSGLLEMDLMEFFTGAQSGIPLAMLKFTPVPKTDIKICPFLAPVRCVESEEDLSKIGKMLQAGEISLSDALVMKNEYGNEMLACGVHGHKPLRCRLYPLGRIFRMDGENGRADEVWYLSDEQCELCKGNDDASEITLSQWIKQQGIEPYLERSVRSARIASKLSEIIKQSLAVINLAFHILYDFDSMLTMIAPGLLEKNDDDAILDAIETSVGTLVGMVDRMRAAEALDFEGVLELFISNISAVGRGDPRWN